MKSRYIIIFLILILCFRGSGQNPVLDSLRNLLKTEKDDTNKVNTLNTLAYSLFSTVPDSTVLLALKASTLAKNIGWVKGEAKAYNNCGTGYFVLGNYPKALEYYLRALKIEEASGNRIQQANILGNIGNIYAEQSDYTKALDYELKSLKIEEKMGSKVGLANTLGSIGGIYMSTSDYPQSLKYYQKALKISEELGDKEVQATNLSNMGNIYQDETGSEATHIHNDSLKKKALDCFQKALKLEEELGDKRLIAYDLDGIGSLYIKMGKFKDAELNMKRAIKIDSAIGELNYLRIFEENISQLYDTTGRYKEELVYYKRAIVLKDSLFNIDKNKALTRKELTYQYEKKEAEEKAKQDLKEFVQRGILDSFIAGFIMVLALAFFIFRGYRQKQKVNVIITQQKEAVEQKNIIIEHQKALVEEKNKDILDSITYAKRLQDAILPPMSLVKQFFPESFVLYKPKDIVAGDFYWMERTGDNILIAAADCTGHGVPGALVSVVCSNALNRTVKEFHITEPGKILDKVRELVLETFEKSESNVQDGMDISLCCINIKTKEVQWSGAYNSLWYIQNGAIHEVSADKQPIGKNDKPVPFNTHKLNLQKGDTLYLFTDGYADQFGGQNGKKFKYKQMEELLAANASKPMDEQKDVLESTLEKWKGTLEQVDDILVIGIRV